MWSLKTKTLFWIFMLKICSAFHLQQDLKHAIVTHIIIVKRHEGKDSAQCGSYLLISVTGITVRRVRSAEGHSGGPFMANWHCYPSSGLSESQVQLVVLWVSYSCPLCEVMALSCDSGARLLKKNRNYCPLKLTNFRETDELLLQFI